LLSAHRARNLVIIGVTVVLAIAALIVVRSCRSAGPVAQPRTYSLTPVWDTKDVGLPIAYHAPSATMLLWQRRNENDPFSPHSITAVKARTGEKVWSGGPSGWDVNVDYIRGGKLTTDAVIVESDYQKNAPAIAALALSDGKVLWQLKTPGQFARPLAVTADVVVALWDTKTLRGLNAADGKTLWDTKVADGCTADEVGGGLDLVVVEVQCEKKRYLESIDPRTGRSRWQHQVSIEGEGSADNLSVRGGAVLGRGQDGFLLLDSSGRLVLEAKTFDRGAVELAVKDDLAVAAYRDGQGRDVLAAVDLKLGAIRWTQYIAVASLSFGDRRLYAMGAFAEPLLPIGLYEIDLATGRLAVSPTHLLHAGYDSLVAVDGGVAVTYYFEHATYPGTSHLEGHRLTPREGAVGFAGGAADGDWPDSCSLLTTAEVAATATGVSYEANPMRVSVAGASLPKPAGCRFQPSTVKAPAVTAGIAWAGSDNEQAAQLMARIKQQNNDVTAVEGIGEEALEIVTWGDPRSTLDIYFRVGSRIGKISMIDDRAVARRLAKLAASRIG
jgi:outer membrane protein assembly factor BamB